MFQLSVLKDTISVPPASFGDPAEQAILRELNRKYANRVVFDLGFAISVFDILKCGDGMVHFGDGCYWYKVTFRLVVFRPFASEVIVAKVKSSTPEGVTLTLGFFDDIVVPVSLLPSPSEFDDIDNAFFTVDPDEHPNTRLADTPKDSRNYIDAGELVRVRVESDEFHDDEPGPPKAKEGEEIIVVDTNKRSPYTIVCSMAEQGAGPLIWWR